MNGPNSDFDISRVRVKRGYTVQKKNYILPTIYPRKQLIRDSTVFYIHTVYSFSFEYTLSFHTGKKVRIIRSVVCVLSIYVYI